MQKRARKIGDFPSQSTTSESKKEGRASLVRRDGMHSNELAQNSPGNVFSVPYLTLCKASPAHPGTPSFREVRRPVFPRWTIPPRGSCRTAVSTDLRADSRARATLEVARLLERHEI